MSFFERLFAKAPANPPGDFAKENAQIIAVHDKFFGDLLELWESECTEAIRAGKRDRENECAAIVQRIQGLRGAVQSFYSKWKLRQ